LAASGGAKITLGFRSPGRAAYGYWGDLEIRAPGPLAVCGAGLAHFSAERPGPARSACAENMDLSPFPPPPLGSPAMSVIIPTHNRAEGVPRVIRRLLAQDFPAEAFEIILVDSRSTDRTPEMMAQWSHWPRVRGLRCEQPGAAAARNLGLDHARGRLLVLMDDDILVGRDFLSQLWRSHCKSREEVLLVKIIAPWEGMVDPFFRFLLQSQEVNIYNFPDPNNVPAGYFYTGCVAVPRAVLGKTRFDEGFTVYGVEDIEFGIRLLRRGTRMIFLDQVRVWHEYFPSFEHFRRKRRHAGYSLGYLLDKRPWLA
jgi:glycosyltransferase involved in cell wall biosynthesis